MTDDGSRTTAGHPSGTPMAGGRVPAADGTPGAPGSAARAALEPPNVLARTTDLVPDWLVNLAELGWRVLVVAALVVVLWLLATVFWTVTASILVAIVVAAVFAPLVLRLRDQGRSRTAAAGIVWVVALLIIGGVLLLLALAFLPYLVELVRTLDTGITDAQAWLASLDLPPAAVTAIEDTATLVKDTVEGSTGGIIASAASAVTIGILATFLVFFFLKDGDKAWVWMFQAVSDQKRERITAAGDDALARVGGYLRGTTILSGTIAVTNFLFMFVLGVPLALPLGILTFFAGFIPYFGGIIATVAILLVAYASQGAGTAALLFVLMAVRTMVLSYMVRPAVYGRTVSIHPALVLIALPAGYELGGIIGLFAAVPVVAVILAVASATVAIVEPDPSPPLPALVPAWLDRVAQFGWRILVAVALVGLATVVMVTVPLVVIPLLIAVILAATLDPLVGWLIARGQTRGRAAAIAVGGGFLLIAAVLALCVVSLVDQAAEVGSTATAGAASVDSALGGQLGLGSQAVGEGAAQAVKAVLELGEALGAAATITVLGTLLAFYFLKDGGRLWRRTLEHVPADAVEPVNAAGDRAFAVLGGYMVGTAAISFVGAFSQLVIMVLLGLPLAFPVFVLSFLLCFIPYLGSLLSTGVAFLIAVAVGSTADVVIMGIWTLVFNIVQGNVVSPLVYGRTVHIHPAIVLVAIPAGAAVAGILGMFVVVPALGVVAATWRTVLSVMGTRNTLATAGAAVGGPTAPTPRPADIGRKDPPGGVARTHP